MDRTRVFTWIGLIAFILACFVVGYMTQPNDKPATNSISTDIWERD